MWAAIHLTCQKFCPSIMAKSKCLVAFKCWNIRLIDIFITASQQINTPRSLLAEEHLMVYYTNTKMLRAATDSILLGWHSDVSYELQPPGFTFLKVNSLQQFVSKARYSSTLL